MTLKIIQINIWRGKLLENLIEFLKNEDPDIITMQEVSAKEENFHENKTLDLFTEIKSSLALEGEVAPIWSIRGDSASYTANAILTKGRILSRNIVWLREFKEVNPPGSMAEPRDWPNLPKNVLDCTIELNSIQLRALSIHGAWTKEPSDTPEKLRQAKILVDYIKTFRDDPFLLGGDFNVPRETKTIQMIEAVARNLSAEPPSRITRSLHPTIHKTAREKPEGLFVDFIFGSKHFTVKSIDAPVVEVSDHLPIRAILEI